MIVVSSHPVVGTPRPFTASVTSFDGSGGNIVINYSDTQLQ